MPKDSGAILHSKIPSDSGGAAVHAPCDLRSVAQLVIEPVHFHNLRICYGLKNRFFIIIHLYFPYVKKNKSPFSSTLIFKRFIIHTQ